MNLCPYCGDLMANPRRKQCGKSDCKRRFNADRMRDYMRERRADPELRAKHREYDRKAEQRVITCEQCGEQAEVVKRSARYCGSTCWQRARRSLTGARHSQIVVWCKDPKWVRVRGPRRQRRSHTWICGTCPCCGDAFVTLQPEARYCSLRCQRRAAKDRWRALQRDAYVAPVNRRAIFERDGWCCRLCGEAVVRDAEVPHPRAPVIDHVVPLARLGTHEPANVQTAHYLCNSIKSDDRWDWRSRLQAA